jgi:hypothetical protein
MHGVSSNAVHTGTNCLRTCRCELRMHGVSSNAVHTGTNCLRTCRREPRIHEGGANAVHTGVHEPVHLAVRDVVHHI